jgi:hypothetical protein
MNEQQWLACTSPQPMLEYLQGRTSDRKLRLFAVACCRRIWHLLTAERSRRAVEAAERVADGISGLAELEPFWVEHDDFPLHSDEEVPSYAAIYAGRESAWLAACDVPANAASEEAWSVVPSRLRDGHRQEVCQSAERAQAGLLRCIVGNPFRPVTFDPSVLGWREGLLVAMARRLYDGRAFADLPVLADALEEAGCTDPEILSHCRSGAEHVRGCFVVDLCLGSGSFSRLP